MNQFEKQVYEINRILRDDKLIVFIGAGVSQNSNYPSGSELAEMYFSMYSEEKPDLIRLNHLEVFENAFVTDKNKFIENIGKVFGMNMDDCKSKNSIVDSVINMNPKHIITTNYDYLIDKSIESSYAKFSKVVNDEDLFNTTSTNLYIKMHGDYEHQDEIVLSESQYLNFSQTHPLIETYIKSLLVDHTLLFIGYSYQDINLKIIMNWIQQRIDMNSNSRVIKHYFVGAESEKISEHKLKYLGTKSIEIVEFNTLITSELYEKIDCPDDISNAIGENLYEVLYYLNKNMTTVTGLKYILKDFEVVNHMFPEDLLNYLGMSKYIRIIDSGIMLHEYYQKNEKWIEDLFKNLIIEIRDKYNQDAEIKKINRIFVNSGILSFIYKKGTGYYSEVFVPEFISHHQISFALRTMDFNKLYKYRDSLINSNSSNTYDLLALVYLNRIFGFGNDGYLHKLLEIRSKLFDEKRYLLMFLVSLDIDKIDFFKEESNVSTYEIIKKIPAKYRRHLATSFAIIDNPVIHTSIMTENLEKTIFSDNTSYGIGHHPLIKSQTRMLNYVKFHYENFSLHDFNTGNINSIIKTFAATLAANIKVYSEYKKSTKDYKSNTMMFGKIEEPQVSFYHIWLFSRYLSRTDISKIFQKYEVKQIRLVDPEHLTDKTNNLINSISKNPLSRYIRDQFISYMYLFLYFESHHKSISNLSNEFWTIVDYELDNQLHDSFSLISLMYNAYSCTEKSIDGLKLLEKVNRLILNSEEIKNSPISLIEYVVNKTETNMLEEKYCYLDGLTELFNLFKSKRSNYVLTVVLLQIKFMPSNKLDNIVNYLSKNWIANELSLSLTNIYILLRDKMIEPDLFMTHIIHVYKESNDIVNSKRKKIMMPDKPSENIEMIERLIEEKLITDFGRNI